MVEGFKEKIGNVYRIPLIEISSDYKNTSYNNLKLDYKLAMDIDLEYLKFVDFIYIYASKDGKFRELITKTEIPDFYLYFYYLVHGMLQGLGKKRILEENYRGNIYKAKDWEKAKPLVFPTLNNYKVSSYDIDNYVRKHINEEQFLSDLTYNIALNKDRIKYRENAPVLRRKQLS